MFKHNHRNRIKSHPEMVEGGKESLILFFFFSYISLFFFDTYIYTSAYPRNFVACCNVNMS